MVEEWIELDNLTVLGTDDFLAEDVRHKDWIQKIPQHPTLCLTHSPEVFSEMAIPPLDLILAGHAHGGQISLPLLGPLWVPHGTGEFISGWYKRNQTHLFVSRGLGWSVAPLRLFCTPELVSIFVTDKTRAGS